MKLGVLLSAMLTIGVGITSFSHTGIVNNNNVSSSPLLARRAPGGQESEISYEDLPDEDMTCRLSSASKTKNHTSVKVEFSATKTTAWGNNGNDVWLVIEDSDFSGDEDNPSLSADDEEIPAEEKKNPSKVTGNIEFAGYTMEIRNYNKYIEPDFFIPRQMKYGSSGRFYIVNKKICTNTIDFAIEEGSKKQNYIKSIIIPSSIETIESEAFVNVPEDVVFKCETKEAPEGWAFDWTDAAEDKIVWGYEPTQDEIEQWDEYEYQTVDEEGNPVTVTVNGVATTGSHVRKFGGKGSYMIGYDNTGENYNDKYVEGSHPLIMTYSSSVKGAVSEKELILPLMDVDNRSIPYDACGDIGNKQVSMIIDIHTEADEVVDFDSICFYNVFKAVKAPEGKTGYQCDLEHYYKKEAVRKFKTITNIDDIITYSLNKVSTFAGYTLVSLNIDVVEPLYYKAVAETIIENNKDKLEKGEYRIRYALYSLKSSSYRVYYMKKGAESPSETTIDVFTPLEVIELAIGSNVVSFIIKDSDVANDFSASRLCGFELMNLTFEMHLWNVKDMKPVSRTSKSFNFGIVDFVPSSTETLSYSDLNLLMVLIFVGYTVVYAAVAVGLFFYLKNKFKNDEFRRMKPKKYVKTSVIGFFGLGVILLAVLAIIYRTAIFRNTLYAFNPSDVLVVLAGIVALVIIGYFIKFMANQIKANKDRRKALKLKLNDDVKDDGTN